MERFLVGKKVPQTIAKSGAMSALSKDLSYLYNEHTWCQPFCVMHAKFLFECWHTSFTRLIIITNSYIIRKGDNDVCTYVQIVNYNRSVCTVVGLFVCFIPQI